MKSKRSRVQRAGGPAWSVDHLPLIAITVVMAAVVIWMGGRSAPGRLSLVVSGTVAAAIGMLVVGRSGRWPRFGTPEALWLLAVAWSALLLVSLPGVWSTEPLLSSLSDGSPAAASYPRSVAPSSSRQAVAVLIGCVLFWLALRYYFRSPAQAGTGIRLVAGYAVALAGFGLVQFLFSNGEFFWIYQHPSRTTSGHVCGPFQNHNHLGYCLAIGLPCTLWSRRSCDSARRWMWDAGTATILVAGLLTFSRSASLLLPLALAGYGLMALRDRRVARPDRHLVLVAAAATVAILLVGGSRIAGRLAASLQSASFTAVSPERFDLWKAVGQAIAHRPVTGYGPGTHASVYPAFIERYYPVVFTHAENSFLQIAVEGGGVALAICMIGLAYLVYLGVSGLRSPDDSQHPQQTAIWRPLTIAFAVAVLHSLVDFAWFVPGCLLPTLVLAATAVAMRSGSSQPAPPPWMRTALAGAVAAAGLAAAGTLIPATRSAMHWHTYRLASSDSDDPVSASDAPQQIAALQRAVQANRDDWRSAERLSMLLIDDLVLRVGSPMQGGAAVRQAIAEGENQQRLQQAIAAAQGALAGNRFAAHAYRTLALAAAYQSAPGDEAAQARVGELIEQGLRVRRHSPQLLITAGEFQVGRGRPDVAFQHWREAWVISPPFRQHLMNQLIPKLPASLILTIFEPTADQMVEIAFRYARAELRDEAAVIADAMRVEMDSVVQQTDRRAAAGALVRQANVEAYVSPQRAVPLLRRAVELDPENYLARRSLAGFLMATGQQSEAVSVVRWCLARRPTDPELVRMAGRLMPPRTR